MRSWHWSTLSASSFDVFQVILHRKLKELENAIGRGYRTTAVAAAYTATWMDEVLLVDATSGAVTVTLPAAASSIGMRLIVKKIDASANAVTIDGSGAETIDGAATQSTTTQYAGWTIVSDGTSWFVL